jgi:uncharacterized protein (DUF924 family)
MTFERPPARPAVAPGYDLDIIKRKHEPLAFHVFNKNQQNIMTTPGNVVGYWRNAGADRWFSKDPDFDRCFRERFLVLHMAASRGELDDWAETPEGALALLILLDQFPRNAFRGSGHMYATDALARHVAYQMIDAGFDRQIASDLRLFCYLPFAHSESLDDQQRSVEFHRELGRPWVDHAEGHRHIIERFGRFPHRNSILGRRTTPEEYRFLNQGGFAG